MIATVLLWRGVRPGRLAPLLLTIAAVAAPLRAQQDSTSVQGSIYQRPFIATAASTSIGGYVEAPCMMRNGLFGLHAFGAAAVSLSGVKSIVPFDEVVGALREVGHKMPRIYKETSLGGLAMTPTGRKFQPGTKS